MATGSVFLPSQLRDRVVIMLLFDQIIREEHVTQAWDLWQEAKKQGLEEPLWRIMATLPELDRDLIHAEAARVYGFYEIRVRPNVATRLIKRLKRQLSAEHWERMVNLRVLPVDEEARAIGYRPKLIFATHDPTRPEAKWLLRSIFPDRYQLGYAPENVLNELLAEVKVEAQDSLAPYISHDRKVPFRIPWIADDGADEVVDEAPESSAHSRNNLFMDRPTFIRLLEDALVAAVEQDAMAVCLTANTDGHTEFHFQIGDELTQWRIEEEIPSKVLMAAIKSYILELNATTSQASRERTLRRWIDGELVGFRMRWCPSDGVLASESVIIWIERDA